MLPPFPPKAPGDRLSYAFDFSSDLLSAESLALNPPSSISATPSGLTIGAAVIAAMQIQAWIEDGAPNTLYVLTCTAATSQGRTIVVRSTLYVGPVGLDDTSAVAPIG